MQTRERQQEDAQQQKAPDRPAPEAPAPTAAAEVLQMQQTVGNAQVAQTFVDNMSKKGLPKTKVMTGD